MRMVRAARHGRSTASPCDSKVSERASRHQRRVVRLVVETRSPRLSDRRPEIEPCRRPPRGREAEVPRLGRLLDQGGRQGLGAFSPDVAMSAQDLDLIAGCRQGDAGLVQARRKRVVRSRSSANAALRMATSNPPAALSDAPHDRGRPLRRGLCCPWLAWRRSPAPEAVRFSVRPAAVRHRARRLPTSQARARGALRDEATRSAGPLPSSSTTIRRSVAKS